MTVQGQVMKLVIGGHYEFLYSIYTYPQLCPSLSSTALRLFEHMYTPCDIIKCYTYVILLNSSINLLLSYAIQKGTIILILRMRNRFREIKQSVQGPITESGRATFRTALTAEILDTVCHGLCGLWHFLSWFSMLVAHVMPSPTIIELCCSLMSWGHWGYSDLPFPLSFFPSSPPPSTFLCSTCSWLVTS